MFVSVVNPNNLVWPPRSPMVYCPTGLSLIHKRNISSPHYPPAGIKVPPEKARFVGHLNHCVGHNILCENHKRFARSAISDGLNHPILQLLRVLFDEIGIESLLSKGVAAIHAYDPLANETARTVFDPSKNILFEKIKYFESAKAAIQQSHALFISSDCEEFRGFSRTIEDTVTPPYLVMDGRRMIPDYGELVTKNFTYLAVGSMVMTPA